MPVFTNPAAIWGSLVFLGLIAVYLFKRKSRSFVVSSLMFFGKSKSTAEGGQKLTKLQVPYILLVEILIFALILLAMGEPMSLHPGQLIPITIVLDDSLSMTAGSKGFTPKDRAIRYLEENIFNQKLYRITLVKSGVSHSIIGKRDLTGAEAENAIKAWTCKSISSNLVDAVSKAFDTSSENAVLMVLTDHIYTEENIKKAKWVAFGTPLDNLAITTVSRTANGSQDRCFVEITNFSHKEQPLEAEILSLEDDSLLEEIKDTIAANASRRLIIKTKKIDSTIKVKIKNDKVDFDNTAILSPLNRRKLGVGVSLTNKGLSESVRKAIKAIDRAYLTSEEPEILICDKKQKASPELLSQLVIHSATQSVLINSLISCDSEHQIASDIPFENPIWAVDKNFKSNGPILIAAGEIPLLWAERDYGVGETFVLNYDFTKSNLHQTNAWPILFYNYIDHALSLLPKTEENNKQLQNQFSYDESNLTKASSTKEMPQITVEENMSHFESVKWWFILLAFFCLALHQWLITRGRSGYAF